MKRKLPPRSHLYKKLLKNFLITLSLMGGSLLIGIEGYHTFGKLSFIDSLLNASMILTGMGPVNPVTTTAGKLFASFYALFSGIIFLAITSILIAPLLYRFMHKFHIEIGDEG